MWFFLLSAPRIYNFSDFFVCTTPHPSTIQRTGVFSKWLFSTNKFLYVNTTQNVYEHVKKINFVACGLLAGGSFSSKRARDTTSYCSPQVNSRNFLGEYTSGLVRWHHGGDPHRCFGKEVLFCRACLWVHFARDCKQRSSVSLEFKFMDFKF